MHIHGQGHLEPRQQLEGVDQQLQRELELQVQPHKVASPDVAIVERQELPHLRELAAHVGIAQRHKEPLWDLELPQRA